ncbi:MULTISPECIES: hypothetical protein [Burkholderia]|uniref:hypothetical protein n=1 Tax=Burkholderia TaxID=32008 RepID=UPI00064EB9CC|nr:MULTISPECIES: hypothetical protein [Burkholderia]KML07900.1 hypothetical protein VL00_26870 [Burkholderia cepacia]KMN62509.1 hypothetical protein VK92_01915 [Burkholderia sp. LK4]
MAFNIEFPFDEYDRKARLAPALLALSPILVGLAMRLSEWAFLGIISSLAISLGGLWLLTDIARRMGKAKQERLFKEWGGSPTVQLLRHSDEQLDEDSKRRYHRVLGTKADVRMPSTEDERSEPKSADAKYRSVQQWLLQNTRDKSKFQLLFNENVTYGFRRNGYGLRRIGLAFCAISVVWAMWPAPFATWAALSQLISTPKVSIQLCTSGVMTLVWLLFFTKETVRVAAFSYAEELLRSCELITVGDTPKAADSLPPATA